MSNKIINIISYIIIFAILVLGGFLYEDGLAWIGLTLELCSLCAFVYLTTYILQKYF